MRRHFKSFSPNMETRRFCFPILSEKWIPVTKPTTEPCVLPTRAFTNCITKNTGFFFIFFSAFLFFFFFNFLPLLVWFLASNLLKFQLLKSKRSCWVRMKVFLFFFSEIIQFTNRKILLCRKFCFLIDKKKKNPKDTFVFVIAKEPYRDMVLDLGFSGSERYSELIVVLSKQYQKLKGVNLNVRFAQSYSKNKTFKRKGILQLAFPFTNFSHCSFRSYLPTNRYKSIINSNKWFEKFRFQHLLFLTL